MEQNTLTSLMTQFDANFTTLIISNETLRAKHQKLLEKKDHKLEPSSEPGATLNSSGGSGSRLSAWKPFGSTRKSPNQESKKKHKGHVQVCGG